MEPAPRGPTYNNSASKQPPPLQRNLPTLPAAKKADSVIEGQVGQIAKKSIVPSASSSQHPMQSMLKVQPAPNGVSQEPSQKNPAGGETIETFLLSSEKEIDPAKYSEANCHSQLLEARKNHNFESQIINLTKIGLLYLNQKKTVLSAKILNCALAVNSDYRKSLVGKDDKKLISLKRFEDFLFSKLLKVEEIFLSEKNLVVPADRTESMRAYRAQLTQNRLECKTSCDQKKPIDSIQAKLTEDFIALLSSLILNCQKILGPPPEKWACIGFGSMARKEMAPYSDIEFAFLLEKSSPEGKNYFRTLSQILELQVINLGETAFGIFEKVDPENPSPTPDGFALDAGGNTPLGVPGLYELIGTPQILAQAVGKKGIDQTIILANALQTVCYVAGDHQLVEEYEKRKLLVSSKKETSKLSNQEFLAWELLKGHLEEFRPNLSKQKEELRAFGIKKELYRPFQETLNCLAILLGLKEKNTFRRIDELVAKKIFSVKGAENLKRVIKLVLELRVKAHLFYQNEEEKVFHPVPGQEPSPHLMYFTEDLINLMRQIYCVLNPFHRCAQNVFEKRKLSLFKKSDFFEQQASTQAEAFQKAIRFLEAQKHFQQAVALNPNDYSSLNKLADVELDLRDAKSAFSHTKSALQLVMELYGEMHPSVAICHGQLGFYYDAVEGDLDQALTHLMKGRDILQKILPNFPDEKVNLGLFSCNIGLIYKKKGDLNEALKYYHKAIDQLSFQAGPEQWMKGLDSNAGAVFQKLAQLYRLKGELDQALFYINEALEHNRVVFGPLSPEISYTHMEAAAIYKALKKDQEAEKCYLQAAEIRLNAFGQSDSRVADVYNDLGEFLASTKKPKKALEYHQKALISYSASQPESRDVAKSYNNIASAYEDLNQNDNALIFYNNAKNMMKKLGIVDELAAVIYNNIGFLYKKSRKINDAVVMYMQSFIMLAQLGNRSLAMSILSNLMNCQEEVERETMHRVFEGIYPHCIKLLGPDHGICKKLGDIVGEEESNELDPRAQALLDRNLKSLEFARKNLGEAHPAVLQNCLTIGQIYAQAERFKEADEYLQQALRAVLAAHGPKHPLTGGLCNNLGGLYGSMGLDLKAMEMFKMAFLTFNELGQINDAVSNLENMTIAAEGHNDPSVLKAIDETLPICSKRLGSNHELTKTLIALKSTSSKG